MRAPPCGSIARRSGTWRADGGLDPHARGTCPPFASHPARSVAASRARSGQSIHHGASRTLARLSRAYPGSDRRRDGRRTRAVGSGGVARSGGGTSRRPQAMSRCRDPTRTTRPPTRRVPAATVPARKHSRRTRRRTACVASASDSFASGTRPSRLGAGLRRVERRLARRARPWLAVTRTVAATIDPRHAALHAADARGRYAPAAAGTRRRRSRDAHPFNPRAATHRPRANRCAPVGGNGGTATNGCRPTSMDRSRTIGREPTNLVERGCASFQRQRSYACGNGRRRCRRHCRQRQFADRFSR